MKNNDAVQGSKPEKEVLGSNEALKALDARLDKLDQGVISLRERLGYVCSAEVPCNVCNESVSYRSAFAETLWNKAERVNNVSDAVSDLLERLDI